MRNRPNPWKWPTVILLATTFLLGGVFLTPRSWIEFFFSPLSLDFSEEPERLRGWLEILPPLEIEVAEVQQEPEPENEDPKPEPLVEWENPAWWQEGWRIKTETEMVGALRPTPPDSVAVLLTELGIGQDFLTMVRPDSVLAVRLHMLKLEDSYKFDEMKPYLSAMTRADAYRDLQSRVADMYDNFLGREIIVPDKPN